jgi:predicted AlkP superfamily pyrophosphatase or phosphodiesterase
MIKILIHMRSAMFSTHRRVVVFGVDGVRIDTLQEAATPHIDAVAKKGFFSTFKLNSMAPTISGPAWANVATGVWPDKHLIYCNEFAGHRLAVFPDFLSRLRRIDPDVRTYAAADWAPLVGTESDGPLFTNPHRVFRIDPQHYDHAETGAEIAIDAARALGKGDYHASFVYFGEPDIVGHILGIGAEYNAAIERSDTWIGQIMDAIASRSSFPEEDWTFIIVTDHGHTDSGDHGGRTEREAQAWIAASGPGIPSGDVMTNHVDIVPSVFAALDLPTSLEWCLAGVPFGTR